jgi:glycosyltransferase involved in cell wall biosynthesis
MSANQVRGRHCLAACPGLNRVWGLQSFRRLTGWSRLPRRGGAAFLVHHRSRRSLPSTDTPRGSKLSRLESRNDAGAPQAKGPAGAMPLVSIGLPVFNGETYLEAAIRSLLAQDYREIELILADNGSTDGTQAICEAARASDERVRYYRSPINRGAAWNYNRCVRLARGEYFKWAAHDDLVGPNFISLCLAELERDPSMVLCQTRAVDIDEAGEVLRRWHRLGVGTVEDAVERFRLFIYQQSQFFEAFGLIRTRILRSTPLIGAYSSSDVPLVARLALHGRFGEVEEFQFQHREHPGRSIRMYADERSRSTWFDTAKEGKRSFPAWRMTAAVLATIPGSPLRGRQRQRQAMVVARWTWQMRGALARDVTRSLRRNGPRTSPQAHEADAVVGSKADASAGELLLGPRTGLLDAPSVRRVTVVVITCNVARTLPRTLESLTHQTYAGPLDVLIVDHGSSDNTLLVVDGWRKRLPPVRVVERSTKDQLITGESSATDFFAVCRGNQQLEPSWLQTLVNASTQADVVVASKATSGTLGHTPSPLHGGVPDWAVDASFGLRASALGVLPGDVLGWGASGAAELVRWLDAANVRVVRKPVPRWWDLQDPSIVTLLRQQFHLGLLDARVPETFGGSDEGVRRGVPRTRVLPLAGARASGRLAARLQQVYG